MQTTFFYLERFLKKLADDQCSYITKGSIYHIKHYVNTTFYHSSGLTKNEMINGCINYVLCLQILRFYLVWQISPLRTLSCMKLLVLSIKIMYLILNNSIGSFQEKKDTRLSKYESSNIVQI